MNDNLKQQTKEDFIKYLNNHKEQRLWQAIRNFSGYSFVLGSDGLPSEYQIDTFYLNGKNHEVKDE